MINSSWVFFPNKACHLISKQLIQILSQLIMHHKLYLFLIVFPLLSTDLSKSLVWTQLIHLCIANYLDLMLRFVCNKNYFNWLLFLAWQKSPHVLQDQHEGVWLWINNRAVHNMSIFNCVDPLPRMSYGGRGKGGYWLCVHTCPISTQSVWQASVAITTPPRVAFLSHQPESSLLSVGVCVSCSTEGQ